MNISLPQERERDISLLTNFQEKVFLNEGWSFVYIFLNTFSPIDELFWEVLLKITVIKSL